MPKLTSALTAIAFAALISGGSSGWAQQKPTTGPTHLSNARAMLQSVPTSGYSDDDDDDDKAAEEVTKLRRQFDELVKAYEADAESASESGWKQKFSEVERTLARLVGGGATVGPVKAGAAVIVQPAGRTTTPPPATGAVEVPAGGVVTPASPPATATPATPSNTVPTTSAGTVVTTPPAAGAATTDTATAAAPVGTSGVAPAAGVTATSTAADAGVVGAAKVSMIGIKKLNPDVRRQLEQFRTELELFYVAPVAERVPGVK